MINYDKPKHNNESFPEYYTEYDSMGGIYLQSLSIQEYLEKIEQVFKNTIINLRE